MSILPKKNDLGFFEIRLESIGGLGANLAGKMLSEAGVVGNGLNGLSFSSYGSEKKGSPVKGNIRFCDPDTNIRDTTPVERPHVVRYSMMRFLKLKIVLAVFIQIVLF